MLLDQAQHEYKIMNIMKEKRNISFNYIMDIKNITLNEKLTLKPLPPIILYCKMCKSNF